MLFPYVVTYMYQIRPVGQKWFQKNMSMDVRLGRVGYQFVVPNSTFEFHKWIFLSNNAIFSSQII